MHQGTIDKIYPTKNFETKNGPSSSREFVLKTDGLKPNYLLLTLQGEMVSTFDNFRLGDSVVVTYDIVGRYGSGNYSDRVFINLYVKSIQLHVPRKEESSVVQGQSVVPELPIEEDNDLPF